MKKILITGGSGFVGGHLIELAQKKYIVHATHFNNPLPFSEIRSHHIDLSKIDNAVTLIESLKPDIILHTAACSNPDFCEKNREISSRLNTHLTEQICRAARRINARFIFTSTDLVFDGKRNNYSETDAANPANFYGKTKFEAERLVESIGGKVVIARLALVYGFGLHRQRTFFESMIQAITAGKKITLFHDQYRSPILVQNLAEALLELAENKFSGIIHLSGGERISRFDFGVKTCKILSLPISFLENKSMFDITTIAARPQDVSMKNELARRILSTKLLNCDEGLQKIKLAAGY
ncbi:MAG TPA: SDR family oxidoreductase [bacterium]|nr:SDR family oxidoreductase [bacterium]